MLMRILVFLFRRGCPLQKSTSTNNNEKEYALILRRFFKKWAIPVSTKMQLTTIK